MWTVTRLPGTTNKDLDNLIEVLHGRGVDPAQMQRTIADPNPDGTFTPRVIRFAFDDQDLAQAVADELNRRFPSDNSWVVLEIINEPPANR